MKSKAHLTVLVSDGHGMDQTNRRNRHEKTGKIGRAREANSALPTRIMTRAYFSSYHLWAANHFSMLAYSAENEEGRRPRFDIKHRAYVTNTILSTVAFLEAAINELFQDVADGHESYVATLDPESKPLMQGLWSLVERARLLEKYQVALTLLKKQQFPAGQTPYQDAALVIDLRNELVHYRPMSLGGDVDHKLASKLAGKFPDNKLMDGSGSPWFPDKCLGHGCATWSIQSMTMFADEFFDRIGVEPNYKRTRI